LAAGGVLVGLGVVAAVFGSLRKVNAMPIAPAPTTK